MDAIAKAKTAKIELDSDDDDSRPEAVQWKDRDPSAIQF